MYIRTCVNIIFNLPLFDLLFFFHVENINIKKMQYASTEIYHTSLNFHDILTQMQYNNNCAVDIIDWALQPNFK